MSTINLSASVTVSASSQIIIPIGIVILRSKIQAFSLVSGTITLTRNVDPEKIKPESIIETQFPEFIQSEYSGMVIFAKKYFKYIGERTENGKIQSIKDIDKTSGDYILKLRKEFSYNSAKFNFLSDTEFIRFAKKFYASKGSEESIKFLFRAMFDEEVEVEYPSENIFIPSAAKWFQLKSIKVQIEGNSRPANEFIGGFLLIRNSSGETQQITVYDVKDLTIKTSANDPSFIFEIFFQDELFIDVELNDYFEGDDFKARIIPSLTKVISVNPGSGFRFGQVIELNSVTGTGAIGIVSSVGPEGSIRTIRILRFGNNYQSSFFVTVSPEGAFTETGSSLETTGSASYNRFLSDFTIGYEESIDVLASDYFANDGLSGNSPFYVLDYTGSYVSQARTRQIFFQEEDTSAILLGLVGVVSTYPGKHLDRRGMPSDASKIQDNFYYQNFSYVIRSENPIDEYRDTVYSFVHPAGTKMFGEQSLEQTFETTTAVGSTTVTIIEN